jgi:hypothetical protein
MVYTCYNIKSSKLFVSSVNVFASWIIAVNGRHEKCHEWTKRGNLRMMLIMTAVPYVASWARLMKFQTPWFLFDGVYKSLLVRIEVSCICLDMTGNKSPTQHLYLHVTRKWFRLWPKISEFTQVFNWYVHYRRGNNTVVILPWPCCTIQRHWYMHYDMNVLNKPGGGNSLVNTNGNST